MIRPTVSNVRVSLYRIATDFPESDGTFTWTETSVVVRLAADGCEGLGYSYADAAAGQLIRSKLGELVVGMDPMNIPGMWQRMQEAVRNRAAEFLASVAPYQPPRFSASALVHSHCNDKEISEWTRTTCC